MLTGEEAPHPNRCRDQFTLQNRPAVRTKMPTQAARGVRYRRLRAWQSGGTHGRAQPDQVEVAAKNVPARHGDSDRG